jgi:molybdenum cofactor cytidylyltransferase
MIAAIVLAAGLSRRMGRTKLTLPWRNTTVIGQVVSVLSSAGVNEILVVTGGARQEIETALSGMAARIVFNPRFEASEMVDSLQLGLVRLSSSVEATLVALGDQPQIQLPVVQAVLRAFAQAGAQSDAEYPPNLIVPSYQMKRGHPWLVVRPLWTELSQLRPPQTLRDFLGRHSEQIRYLPVSTDTILRDLDTPDDYAREKPAA